MISRLLFITLLSAVSIISHGEDRPNILLICVDDLRPELGCYGVDYISSPHIDALAAKGRVFRKHFVQAPTCGASRYTLLTGRYGTDDNHALFKRAKEIESGNSDVTPSMPAWFRERGYTTVSVGKVSHHPGGMGGPDWNKADELEMPNSWDRSLLPSGPWQHPRGWMHGLAHGEIRKNAKDMALIQAVKGDDSIYPDGDSVDVALEQLRELGKNAAETPFFLACGILRPHLPFGAPEKYLRLYDDVELPPIPHPEKPEGTTTWHKSGEFMKYNRWGRDPNTDPEFAEEVRKHYAACVSYADAQVGKLTSLLAELNLSDNTILVLWGDHGWHLGEHAIWGKHALFEKSLHSPLIISYPGLPEPGADADGVVETLDVFPTLAELSGGEAPEFLEGTSLVPMLEKPETAGHVAIAYRGGNLTIRTSDYRLIQHRKGAVELYDFTDPSLAGKNVAAENPEIVSKLAAQLKTRRPAAK